MAVADLRRFAAELAELRRDCAALVQDLEPQSAGWRPAQGGWSVAQVIAHLRTTDALYADAMRRAMDRSDRGASDRDEPHRPSLFGGWLTRMMSSPRRLPAPRVFRPPTEGALEWPLELERYRAGQDVMEGLVSDAAGVGLNRTRLASPVSPLLRINLGDAFSVCLAHGRRHMDQIRRLRSLPDFPKAPPTD